MLGHSTHSYVWIYLFKTFKVVFCKGEVVIIILVIGSLVKLEAKVLNKFGQSLFKGQFNEVYAKAKAKNPELPANIKMFINDNDEPNAFATGRKTLCVTKGLLSYNDQQIKGVLAHEFGHLAHKDTDTILVVAVGNMIMNAIFIFVRVVANLFMWLGEILTAIFSDSWGGIFASICIGIGRVVADFLLVLFMRIWTQIGVWLCMYSSRKNEYRADAYAHFCGYGADLAYVLESFGTARGSTGLFAALASSHPENIDRINKLRSLRPVSTPSVSAPDANI